VRDLTQPSTAWWPRRIARESTCVEGDARWAGLDVGIGCSVRPQGPKCLHRHELHLSQRDSGWRAAFQLPGDQARCAPTSQRGGPFTTQTRPGSLVMARCCARRLAKVIATSADVADDTHRAAMDRRIRACTTISVATRRVGPRRAQRSPRRSWSCWRALQPSASPRSPLLVQAPLRLPVRAARRRRA